MSGEHQKIRLQRVKAEVYFKAHRAGVLSTDPVLTSSPTKEANVATNHCNILAFSPQASTESKSLDLATMPFPAAATAWLASREPYISPKTFHEYKLNIKTLSRYFGAVRLIDISSEMIRDYQRVRSVTWDAVESIITVRV